MEELIVGAYAVTNSLRVLSYLPQILLLIRTRDRAAAISLTTWSLWTLSHVTMVAYAASIARDALLIAMFAGNAICCVVVIAIVLWKRRRYANPPVARTGSVWSRT
jgi:uncharacterized protein with PQ loop repeat